MKHKKHQKRSLSKKIASTLEIPEDVIFDIPRMTICDNTELRLENYKTVLEYEENNIKLACKEKLIHITGKNLNINIIADDEISICGTISSIEYS